jgi:hypothetical protein
MHVIEARRDGGPHGDVYVCRCIGDFGIPNLHRFGWCYRPVALDRISCAVNSRLARKEF